MNSNLEYARAINMINNRRMKRERQKVKEMDDKDYEKMVARKVAHSEATVKYNQNNVKQIKLNLNLKTDADIIKALEAVPNKQGYIKELIRKDLNK